MKIVCICLSIAAALFFLTGCPDPMLPDGPDIETYSVTYDANGADGGTVPETASYEEGAAVTVVGNTGGLVRDGYTFTGWNTVSDGSGRTYVEDDIFSMLPDDMTLYARWTENQTYTVTYYRGESEVEGDVPVDNNRYEAGDEVTARWNTEGLTKNGHVFRGWNSVSDGSGAGHPAGSTFAMPERDLNLYSQWDIDPLGGISYRDMYDVTGVDDGSYTQRYGFKSGQSFAEGGFVHNISDYRIGVYEVTYELWYSVYQWANENGYAFSNPGTEGNDGDAGTEPTAGAQHEPVTMINWRDAIVWCNAYSELQGFRPVYYTDSGYTSILKD
jgi:uncharacterized repeat protein (TIGR02543 family)